jgi:hypothetical protein
MGDPELRNAGDSGKEIREKKIVRLVTVECMSRERCLRTHRDVAFLLHARIHAYMSENGVIVPTRGVIYDR